MNGNTYYTEPQKEAKKEKGSNANLWFVNQINRASGKVHEKFQFHSEQACNDFLNTKSVYINGELMYRGL